MGNGDNRSTKLTRQRTAWRKKKARLRKAMEEGMAAPKRRATAAPATGDVKKKTTTTAPKPAVTRKTT